MEPDFHDEWSLLEDALSQAEDAWIDGDVMRAIGLMDVIRKRVDRMHGRMVMHRLGDPPEHRNGHGDQI